MDRRRSARDVRGLLLAPLGGPLRRDLQLGSGGPGLSEEDLDGVLEDLYREGSFDSQGQFTLRADKAAAKLSEFQLGNPHDYALNLLAVGAMAGARTFRFELGVLRSEFHLEGAGLPLQELERVFSYLLYAPQTPVEWALQELAIGLKACQRTGAYQLSLCCGGHRLTISGNEVQKAGPDPEGRDMSLSVEHSRGLGTILKGVFKPTQLPEVPRLTEALQYSVVPGVVRVRGDRFSTPDPLVLEEVGVKAPLASVSEEQGWLALGEGGEPGRSRDSRLTLVIRGRPFHQRFRLGSGQITGVWRADHLKLDLSQSAPVQDSSYLELLRSLSQKVERLRYDWLRSHRRSDVDERTYRVLARQVARTLRVKGRITESLEILDELAGTEYQCASLRFQKGELQAAHEILHSVELDDLPPHRQLQWYSNLATVEGCLGWDSAQDQWEKSFHLTRKRAARKEYLLGKSMELRLEWMTHQGRNWELYLEVWEQARKFKEHLGPQHIRQAGLLELGALIHLNLPRANPVRARELAGEAHDIRVRQQGEGDPRLACSLAVLSLCHVLEDTDEAVRLARHRLNLVTAVYGEDHPEVAASHTLLAKLGVEGHRERALGLLESYGLSAWADPICFRGWYHSRGSWRCTVPLCWPVPSSWPAAVKTTSS